MFVGDPLHITEVSSNHMPGKTNSDVVGFYIINQHVGFFPKNISNFFPNLEAFGLYWMGIKDFRREDLYPFHNLKLIDLNGNQIRDVNNNLFEGNPKMRFIAFYNNTVRHVAHNVFDHLDQLEELNFVLATCLSLVANGREQIQDILFKIAVNCPPTFDMIFERTEEKLLKGIKLEKKIDEQVSVRINPLTLSLYETREKVEMIDQRVSKLESELINLKLLKRFLTTKSP